MAHGTSPVDESMVTIEVKGGRVIDVVGIPEHYSCEILDHDEPKHKPEALYLATINILVRSTSPGRAADVIHHTVNDQETEHGVVIDWDYAVQDGERQHPKCVSLDLEPGNITELLDHLP